MASITLQAEGDVSVEVAWERYADPARWPDWSPQVRQVDTSAPRIAAGVRGAVLGPLGLRVAFVVEDVDEAARYWVWRVRRWPVRLRLTHTVEPAGAGTSTTLTIEGPIACAALYAPLAQLALNRLVSPSRRAGS